MEKNFTASGNHTVNNKIQDFGEKIGGARKDWFANIKEAARKFAEVGAVDLVAAPLSKVVTLPNLEKMTEAGALSTDSARAVMTIWRNIGARPAGSAYLLQRWAEKAAPKLARIGAILNGDKINDEERAAVDFRILSAANWPAVSFSFGRVETGRTYSGMMYASTGRRYLAKSNNAADIVAAIRTQTEQDAQKRAEGVRLAICSNRVGEYFVTPEHKTEIVLFRGSYAECYDQKEHHADELRARYAEIKNVPALRRDWNRPRVGEDWRKGQDITPETFAGALPFRGVEFGNWVTQAERASLLNAAFDGFHDLSQMLGVAVERVTLGGTLAFAFASRGTSKAMAHYEPGRQDDSHEPQMIKSFGTEAQARKWLRQCADCCRSLSFDDMLACAGGYWVVWYDGDRGGYYCQFVAPCADAHDLSGALLRYESLHLRRRVHEFKRKHIARQVAKEVAKIQAGEMLTVEYRDMVASVKIGGYGFRRYEFTFWIRNRIRERRFDLTAAEAAQAVADFVACYVPARARASHDCQLHTFAITATDYDSPETPPYAAAFQSVDCTPKPSQVAPRA